MHFLFQWIGVWLVLLHLGGCANSNVGGVYKMFQALEQPNPNRFEQFEFRPGLFYLEAHSPTAQVMMVLGYTMAAAQQPPVQTWYDADKQLMRLQNGLLLGITGAPNSIEFASYEWPAPPPQGQPWLPVAFTFNQPAQQVYGKTTRLQFDLLSNGEVPIKNSVLRSRLTRSGQALTWYSMKMVDLPQAQLPQFLFAFNANGQAVYGSHCLLAKQCYEWLFRN